MSNALQYQRRRWQALEPQDRQVLAKYSAVQAEHGIPLRPALLVVDVTPEYVGPNAPVLEAQNWSRRACGSNAWQALPKIQLLLSSFRALALPVVHAVPSDTATVGSASRTENYSDLQASFADLLETGVREGQVLSELVDSLQPARNELVMHKSRASAFFATTLVQYLIAQRIDGVMVVGCTTSGCVRASAVDAYSFGFQVAVVEDACFDRVQGLHDMALLDVELKYGRVLAASEVVDELDRAQAM